MPVNLTFLFMSFVCGSLNNHTLNPSLIRLIFYKSNWLQWCKSHILPCLLLLGFLLIYRIGMHCARLVNFPTLAPLMCLWLKLLFPYQTERLFLYYTLKNTTMKPWRRKIMKWFFWGKTIQNVRKLMVLFWQSQ